jgi:hypothetical protein
VFSGASLALRDPEWKIEEDDAAELSKRTIKLLKTLDAKTADKLEKKIAKYAPSLSLLMALGSIVAPRVAHTRSKRNAVHLQTESGRRAAETGRSATSAHSGDVANPLASSINRNGNGDNQGADAIRITPLRRSDGSGYFGGDEL